MRLRKHAPAGFTWCGICRGWQHPHWHVTEWREARFAEGDHAAVATYDKAPLEGAPEGSSSCEVTPELHGSSI